MSRKYPSYKFRLTDKEVTVNIGNDYVEILGYKGVNKEGQTEPPYDHKTIRVKKVHLVQDFRES